MVSLNIRRALSVTAALVVAATVSVSAHAQNRTADKMNKMDKMGHKMDKMAGPVYACKECKMAYSPADAKKMGYKDGMGHKLAKMDKMPAGMKMSGGKMDHMGKMDKMGHKMDKMEGDKKMEDKPLDQKAPPAKP